MFIINKVNKVCMFDLFNRPKLWTDFLSLSMTCYKGNKISNGTWLVVLIPEGFSINS